MSRSTTTTPTAPQAGKPVVATTTQAQPSQGAMPMGGLQEKVAARAYQKWLQKGCMHGNDKQDWLEAEAEVRAEMARTGGTSVKR